MHYILVMVHCHKLIGSRNSRWAIQNKQRRQNMSTSITSVVT